MANFDSQPASDSVENVSAFSIKTESNGDLHSSESLDPTRATSVATSNNNEAAPEADPEQEGKNEDITEESEESSAEDSENPSETADDDDEDSPEDGEAAEVKETPKKVDKDEGGSSCFGRKKQKPATKEVANEGEIESKADMKKRLKEEAAAAKKAEQEKKVEEKRLAKEKKEEEKRQAEEEKRLAKEKKDEEKRLAKEKKDKEAAEKKEKSKSKSKAAKTKNDAEVAEADASEEPTDESTPEKEVEDDANAESKPQEEDEKVEEKESATKEDDAVEPDVTTEEIGDGNEEDTKEVAPVLSKAELKKIAKQKKLDEKKRIQEEKAEAKRLLKEQNEEAKRLIQEKKAEVKRLEQELKMSKKKGRSLDNIAKKSKEVVVVEPETEATEAAKEDVEDEPQVVPAVEDIASAERSETMASKNTVSTTVSEEIVVGNVLFSERMDEKSLSTLANGSVSAIGGEGAEEASLATLTKSNGDISSIKGSTKTAGGSSSKDRPLSVNLTKDGKKVRPFFQRFSLQDTSNIPKRYSDQLRGSNKALTGSRLNVVETASDESVNTNQSAADAEDEDVAVVETESKEDNAEVEDDKPEDEEVVDDVGSPIMDEARDEVNDKLQVSDATTQAKYIPSFHTITKSFRNAFKNISSSKEQLDHVEIPDHLKLNIYVMTWNMGGHIPKGDLNDMLGSLEDAVDPPFKGCQVVAICTQECEKSYAQSLLKPEKKVWEATLDERLSIFGYIRHATKTNAGLHIALYAMCDVVLKEVHTASCTLGVEKMFKGAAAIAFELSGYSFCFVNSHLTAGEGQCHMRNKDYTKISKQLNFQKFPRNGLLRPTVGERFDYIFWSGDLNYRTWLGEGSPDRHRHRHHQNGNVTSLDVKKKGGSPVASRRKLFSPLRSDTTSHSSDVLAQDKNGSSTEVAAAAGSTQLKKRKSFLFRKVSENHGSNGGLNNERSAASGERARKARSFIFLGKGKSPLQKEDSETSNPTEKVVNEDEERQETSMFGISQMTLGDQLRPEDEAERLPGIDDEEELEQAGSETGNANDDASAAVDSGAHTSEPKDGSWSPDSKLKASESVGEALANDHADETVEVVKDEEKEAAPRKRESSEIQTTELSSIENINGSGSQLHLVDKKEKRKSLMTTLLRRATMRSPKKETIVEAEKNTSESEVVKSNASLAKSMGASSCDSCDSSVASSATDINTSNGKLTESQIGAIMELPLSWIRRKCIHNFLDRDELRSSYLKQKAFAGYSEGPINFLPTYKFDVGVPYPLDPNAIPPYDSSSKERVPSYTDRILFKCKGGNTVVGKTGSVSTPTADSAEINKESEAVIIETDTDKLLKSEELENSSFASNKIVISPSENKQTPSDGIIPDSYNMHNVFLGDAGSVGNDTAIKSTQDLIMGPFSGEVLSKDEFLCCEDGVNKPPPIGHDINRQVQVKKYSDLVTIVDSDHKPVYAKFTIPTIRLDRS